MGNLLGDKKTNTMRFFSAAMCVFVAAFAIASTIILFNRDSGFSFVFCSLAILLIAVFCGLVWFINSKKISTTTALIISAVVLSVCYLFLFPPITVPDEQAHYLSAYRISNYFLFDFSANSDDGILMRECDARLFGKLLPNVNGEYINFVYNEFSLFASDADKVFYSCGFVKNAPFSYILSAFGIALARILNLGALATFFVGRIINLAGFIALLMIAVKKIPFGKNVLPMIAALPITMHLSASLSYDAITLGFAFVFISQVLYMREKETINWKDIVVLTIFAVLLAPSKSVYTPLILLVFIIPNSKFGSNAKKALLLKSLIVFVAIGVFLMMQLSNVSSISTKQTSGWTDEPPYNIGWILSHPIGSCKILFNTFLTFAYFYIKNLFGGLLGWLNVSVPIYLWVPQMLLILLSAVRYKNEENVFAISEKLWIWVCLFASAGLIMLSMFVAWTPMGSSVIYGIQGRYFLPLVLPLVLVLRCKCFALSEQIEKYVSLLYMTFGFATVMNLFLIVTG